MADTGRAPQDGSGAVPAPGLPQPSLPQPVGRAEPASQRPPEPGQLSRSMADVAERSRRMVGEWLRRQGAVIEAATQAGSLADPLGIGGAFLDMTARLMASPARVMQAQIGFWQDYMTLWQTTTRRMWGLERGAGAAPPGEAAPTGEAGQTGEAAAGTAEQAAAPWKQAEVFDFVKQSYLLSARSVLEAFGRQGGLTPALRQKADFYTRHFAEAMSPRHFLLTSPAMLRRTAETGGENLLRGLTSLLSDLDRDRFRLDGPATGPGTAGFRLGETVGATPGKVVHQTAVMQLIQYAPTTVTVLRRPLLIVPPWFGKFYVLDLQPRNSFVRWAVAQGHTVFMVSWADPAGTTEAKAAAGTATLGTAALGNGAPGTAASEPDLEDYVTAGIAQALEAIERATGERRVNVLGYGLGGTLLAAACAWLAARGEDRVASLTLLAAMLDFEQTGELGVFIDEEHLSGLQPDAAPEAPLASAATHALLRANDLIWSFVVNTFLAGNEAFPFDLLAWNADGTRMPARLHGFYLQHLYRDNELAQPGVLVLAGQPIDLGRVSAPAYVLAARDDRISPWTSCWRGMRLLGGPARFVLAGSGHLSGVVNPPGSGKYGHWVSREAAEDPEAWFAGAVEIAGSWWSDWARWVGLLDRDTVPARVPGTALEDAPGSFVRGKAA